MIFFILMLLAYIAGNVLLWAISGAEDYEGDYLFAALAWTCLGWTLPMMALMAWLS